MTGSSTFSIAWNGEEYCIFRIRSLRRWLCATYLLFFVRSALSPVILWSVRSLSLRSLLYLPRFKASICYFERRKDREHFKLSTQSPFSLRESSLEQLKPPPSSRELARILVFFRYFCPCSTAVQIFLSLTFFPACVMVFQAKKGCLLYQ